MANGVTFACASKYMLVGGENIDIGANPTSGDGETPAEDEGVDDSVEKKLDLVHSFRLQPYSVDKKGFMAMIKVYMKKVKEYLAANKPERVEAFFVRRPDLRQGGSRLFR
eukprot:JZ554686.1.p1 GENE.JZ554686.1~~JZ554686.1.p1  ORF type:complete len:110 (+),score=50.19 JZ554686.1:96-425(+)